MNYQVDCTGLSTDGEGDTETNGEGDAETDGKGDTAGFAHSTSVLIATFFLAKNGFYVVLAPPLVKNLAIRLHSRRTSCMFVFAENDSGRDLKRSDPPQAP